MNKTVSICVFKFSANYVYFGHYSNNCTKVVYTQKFPLIRSKNYT